MSVEFYFINKNITIDYIIKTNNLCNNTMYLGYSKI